MKTKKNIHRIFKEKYLNYGLIEKHHKNYRKALRECKKTKKRFMLHSGFDYSELWNIDTTFMKWLYNQNWIKEHRDFIKAYAKYDLDKFISKKYGLKETDYQEISEKQSKLVEDIFNEIEKLGAHKKTKISAFLIPRLIVFKENLHGYPAIMTEEEWNQYIDDTIEEIRNYKYNKLRDEYAAFWD